MIDSKGFWLKFWHYKDITWRHSDMRVKFVFQCEHRWMRWIRSETFLNSEDPYGFVRQRPVRPGPNCRRHNSYLIPYSKMYSEGKRKLPFASELLNHSICKLLDRWSPPSVCSKFISNWNMAVAYWSSIFWKLKFRMKNFGVKTVKKVYFCENVFLSGLEGARSKFKCFVWFGQSWWPHCIA